MSRKLRLPTVSEEIKLVVTAAVTVGLLAATIALALASN